VGAGAGAGRPLARGRDADVYDLGEGRVLRRYRRPGPTDRERRVMAHARAHGYPVPRVYASSATDMVMDRLHGPSMLDDLARRPWRLVRHARTLAELHRRLHAIPAPADLPAPLGEGDRLVHLDLHPANVVLTADGPAVIDWPNAGRGDGLADVAATWVILRTSRLEGAAARRLLAALGQRLFASAFLAGFDRRQVLRHLPVVVAARLADRNVTDRERVLLRRLMAGRWRDLPGSRPPAGGPGPTGGLPGGAR
jgi:aminoglycoside phosphotransferase (APT) family kinase protein